MKKIKQATIATICVTAALLLSCIEKGTEYEMDRHESVVINIDPSEETGLVTADQYTIDSIVSLDIPEKAKDIIVERFEVAGGRIYIMDSYVNKTIFVFNSKGEYLYKLGERGRAIYEYTDAPTDFFVDKFNNVYVFDQAGQKVMVFDRKGRLLNSTSASRYWAMSFGLASNNRYAYSKNGKGDYGALVFSDWNHANERNVLPCHDRLLFEPTKVSFFRNGDRLSHIPVLSDSVLVFREDSLIKTVKFKFKGGFLKDDIPEVTSDLKKTKEIKDYKGVISLYSYQETDNLILLEYLYQKTVNRWLYNKATGQVVNNFNMFEGTNPSMSYILKDKQMIGLVQDDILERYSELKDDPAYQAHLSKSPSQIQQIMAGEVKLPLIIFYSLK